MQNLMDIIISRRSVRRFRPDMPAESVINEVLEAGRWAPSGLNNQPWRFKVIKDRAQKDGLSRFTKYGAIIKSAAVAIAVCLDTADSYNRDKDIMAIGACIQNMLLEACASGLGACWLGEILNKKQDVSKYLGLAADLEVMAVIVLGYPAEDKAEGSRKALQDLIV